MKLKILGFSLIFINLFALILIDINDKQKLLEEINLINQLEYKDMEFDYLGYIEIPKINLKKIIKQGTNQEILNEGYVGLLTGKTINNSNIVLAGHNIESVFKNIKKLTLNDTIYVYFENKKYEYQVIKILTIEIDELNYLNDTEEKKLTLITCTDKNKRRFIVISELKSVESLIK